LPNSGRFVTCTILQVSSSTPEFPAYSQVFLRNYNGPHYSYGRRLPGLRFDASPPQKWRITSPLNLPAPGTCQALYILLTSLQSPVFLVNSRGSHFTAAFSGSVMDKPHPTQAPLLPKLRGQVAEFLSESSLAGLRVLPQPTCVGLRYGHLINSLRGFSRDKDSITSSTLAGGLVLPLWSFIAHGFATGRPPGLNRYYQSPADLSLSVTPSVITFIRWGRNINRLCIAYAFRPRLSSRLTLGGRTFPRKP